MGQAADDLTDPDGYPVLVSVRPVVINYGPRDNHQPSAALRSFNLAAIRIDWLVTLGGGLGSVRVQHTELLSYARFRQCCAAQLQHIFPTMPRKAWLEQVAKALEPFRE